MYDLIVVGGGPAGLAASLSGREHGLSKVLIVERDRELGGILNQCIHNGFGLRYFKEELSGPEYAGRFIEMLRDTGIEIMTDTMALDITPAKEVHVVRPSQGYRILGARAIILAMGCRERSRGAVMIPGTRPAGVLTAGAAQRYVNIEGRMVGKRIVILGSGDIGLIMARRMTLEGAKVLACVELMPYSSGLKRNIVQCLDDFGIPLYLSHTVVDVRGQHRVEGVTVARVDENKTPVPSTEFDIECDTLLLSVGLIPENELTKRAGIALDPRTNGARVGENMETSLPGVFACGNVLHVHDVADFVTEEARRAGAAAAEYARSVVVCAGERETLTVQNGACVTYTVPQTICPRRAGDRVELFFRVTRSFGKSVVRLTSGGEELARYRRAFMAPGEMERIVIKKDALASAHGKDLTVSAEEDV